MKHSSLVTKDLLVKELDNFVGDAKSAGRGLQKFGSQVGGTIDRIVAKNEYALLLLEQVAKDMRPEISSGPVNRVLDAVLPSKNVPHRDIVAQMRRIEAVWFEATGLMKTTVEPGHIR